MAGGVLVSASTPPVAIYQTFLLFVAGHVIWLYASWRESNNPLAALNLAMLSLDFWAVFVRF